MFKQIILLCLLFLAATTIADSRHASRCVGATPCEACSTCSSCRYCAQEGGTCGVCKPAGVGVIKPDDLKGNSYAIYYVIGGVLVAGGTGFLLYRLRRKIWSRQI